MSELSLSTVQALDPTLAPHWRADRVRSLLNSYPRRRPNQYDDPAIGDYYRFCLELSHNTSSHRFRQKWMRRNPGLLYAHDLRTSPDHAESQLLMESRILAGMNQLDIASAAKTMPETVNAYEKLFFDVRPFLMCRDWIATKVLAPTAISTPLPERQIITQPRRKFRSTGYLVRPHLDLSLKTFSYYLGPIACDSLIRGFWLGEPITDPTELPKIMDRIIQQQMQIKTMQTVHAMELNPYNVNDLLQGYGRVLEIREKSGSTAELGPVEKVISDIFDGISSDEDQRLFSPEKNNKEDEAVREKAYNMSAELDADEVIHAVQSKEVPKSEDVFDFSFGKNHK